MYDNGGIPNQVSAPFPASCLLFYQYMQTSRCDSIIKSFCVCVWFGECFVLISVYERSESAMESVLLVAACNH